MRRQAQLSARRNFARENDLFFDRNLSRQQIYLPRNFSLHDNHDETAEVLVDMRETVLHGRGSVMLHFEEVEQLDPAAALVLVAEIHRLRNLRGKGAVTGTYPRSADIYGLLCDMGFYQLLEVEERRDFERPADDPTRPIFLRFITGNRVDTVLVDRFVGTIEDHVFSMSTLARDRLVAAIVEAMNNTLDHAHPVTIAGETMPRRWWMSAWLALADKEVALMLFDQGVGIPNTIEPNIYERVRAALAGVFTLTSISSQPSDGELILAATELHRTGTGQPGRGQGFGNMKRFIDVCHDGEMRVLSNRGRYRYLSGTESCSEASTSIGGTVIEWRFRHDGSVELGDD